jgi:hypothetical protein
VNPQFGALVLPQEIEGNLTEHGEILRRMANAYSRVIFPKSNILHPMPTLFYLPMFWHRLGKPPGIISQTAKVPPALSIFSG